MTRLTDFAFAPADPATIDVAQGHVAVFITPDGRMDACARRADRLSRGALKRWIGSDAFGKAKPGSVTSFAYPAGMAAEALHVAVLPNRPDAILARKTGAALARARGRAALLVCAGSRTQTDGLALGLALRDYSFDAHRTPAADETARGAVTLSHATADDLRGAVAVQMALADGVVFTRDLVNEPANVLTTTEFADRLSAMTELGLTVEVLDEEALAELGMRTLLSVGQGSDSPSKVVIMRWDGGEKNASPLALVGKGVVFDTGGISIKPAAGMEEMTMDMGGGAVVAGVMRALALRKARANVVGLVGLVENMPSGTATRPGDVVKSMKGDTVEIINTDAEGRLVLCDVMWYAQERFKPAGMIDLATLTGAIIIGLGHENAGVFSNDDAFCDAFLGAAKAEDEGAWRMPLGQAYDDLLKSRIADMKNVGGRAGGSITAAQFLKRFVKDGTPWIHLDIAGVASVGSDTRYAPKGATGWGVLALNRLIADKYEAR